MKKQVIYKTRGHRADIGPIELYRLLSNNYVDHVGHFVFLDYAPPFVHKNKMVVNDDMAHPHRGIATLTYVPVSYTHLMGSEIININRDAEKYLLRRRTGKKLFPKYFFSMN